MLIVRYFGIWRYQVKFRRVTK